MCGIAGLVDLGRRHGRDELIELAALMAGTLAHRGPDDAGTWCDEDSGVAFGHRRLAVLDLSAEGHQPMVSAGGRYVVVFNGEIYNFPQLRDELTEFGHSFRGHSDTEVLLAAIQEWGVRAAVERLNGMFAIALWDRADRNLHLVRDRLGEKPVYFGRSGDTFAFASELKALKRVAGLCSQIDRTALREFLRFGWVPGPRTIYQNVWKLQAGTILRLDVPSRHQVVETYWSAVDTAARGTCNGLAISRDEAVERLEALLRDAVRIRMISDVPLGAFLSGGIDSSTVVALMQALSRSPVKTFTIGFREEHHDEAAYARAVAHHLGTDHTELYVTPRDALQVVPLLPAMYDEPFADMSAIPTFLVSQLARRQVTVSLSGDGGDELFGGYDRYRRARRIWNAVAGMPRPARRSVARMLTRPAPSDWDRWLSKAPGMQPLRDRGHKIHRVAEILDADSPSDLYRQLLSHWQDPTSVVLGAPDQGRAPEFALVEASLTERMMCEDVVGYLPDDILVKLDRAAMRVSLETRVPLLDHRVVEFAWSLPLGLKVRGRQSKLVLMDVLHRYVPAALVDRPKMGFGVPMGEWLRGPLREWAESLLDEAALRAGGFLDPAAVRTRWQEHLTGRRNWQYALWDVLMFQAWLDCQDRAAG